MEQTQGKLYRTAYLLSLFTIGYNILEGFVSLFFGFEDETLTLAGFGADSFIEVISGVGIAVMVVRIRGNAADNPGQFEYRALRITGTAFYLLSVLLLAGTFINVVNLHKPETTLWGVVISLVSIAVMSWLYLSKKKTGKGLGSKPILADAECTKICIYMSVVLLAASLIYELTGFAFADAIGAAGLIYFSLAEGKEAFEKARELSAD